MKNVLITGGSSGIGYEVSKYFAQNNYRILWVSKPLDELQKATEQFKKEFPNTEVHFLQKDLSEISAPQEVFQWVKQNQWQLDVLINNAGFGTYGLQHKTSQEKEIAMIQLHTLTVYQLTRLFLSEMLPKNEGTIINISSISALQPIPRMNTYASTKAFVKHFSMGLQQELHLQKSKVKVLTICPAAINNTAFKDTDNLVNVKTYRGLVTTTVEEVARDIWRAFSKGKTFLITGKKARLLYTFKGFIPAFIQKYLVEQETEVVG